MKSGKTLEQLAAELTRVKNTARDFVVPTSRMSMEADGSLVFANGTAHTLTPTEWAHGQIASYTDIPKGYYDRIKKDNPVLFRDSVNHGFQSRDMNDRRLVRTVDGRVRGFLSNKYKILDGYDILTATLPTLLENGFSPVSSELTERRMYLKATTPKLTGEIKKGDAVQYGVMISTSDVGAGSLKIEPYVERLVCLNGMILPTKFNARHLGRALSKEMDITELLSDETRDLDARATLGKARDVLIHSLRPEIFAEQIRMMQEAAGMNISMDKLRHPEEIIEVTSKTIGVTLSDASKKDVLAALLGGNEGAGLTLWGLANAFTRAAQADHVDYDKSTEMERAGGEIITLNRKEWERIAV